MTPAERDAISILERDGELNGVAALLKAAGHHKIAAMLQGGRLKGRLPDVERRDLCREVAERADALESVMSRKAAARELWPDYIEHFPNSKSFENVVYRRGRAFR